MKWVTAGVCEKFIVMGKGMVVDPGQIPAMLVFQILTLYDSIHVINVDKVVAYVQSLQKEDGSFAGDIWGKIGFHFF